ncbi:MAG TPA: hypothetical protein PK147_01850 [Saprospiraceae bacterium]|nr:hypothetical protein [Saprospiraceae bacterium]MCB9327238.1 hypothetical protein [Lewinellaceae bacterium]HPK10645.1 hypothetical protein [Saprospiraceae bacterium]HPQ20560.1 hypothetical protein [Saprospiraceae bacterium]HRX29016.1 hypothetical protein [Saprospiraceae bacterium]
MKRILIVMFFSLVTNFLIGQNEDAKMQAQAQVEKVNSVISGIDPSLQLSQNQIVKLERLYMEKRLKINELKTKNLYKNEFSVEAKKIEDNYKYAIDAVFTPDQKYAFYNRRKSLERQ